MRHFIDSIDNKNIYISLWLGWSLVITSSLTLERKICPDYLSTSSTVRKLYQHIKTFLHSIRHSVFSEWFSLDQRVVGIMTWTGLIWVQPILTPIYLYQHIHRRYLTKTNKANIQLADTDMADTPISETAKYIVLTIYYLNPNHNYCKKTKV